MIIARPWLETSFDPSNYVDCRQQKHGESKQTCGHKKSKIHGKDPSNCGTGEIQVNEGSLLDRSQGLPEVPDTLLLVISQISRIEGTSY